MNRSNLQKIAERLADGLRESLCSNQPRIFPQLLRLLAEGRPVSPERIAAGLEIPTAEVVAGLRHMASVEYDPQGNIVGSGLTLTPTPHSFQVNDQHLFTWCAFDTLFFPAILQQPAQVESRCPVTGTAIRLRVTPQGVEDLAPGSAVVSIVFPDASEACCGVRGAFCDEVHFFSSLEAASKWLTENKDGVFLEVHEAHELGRILADVLFDENSTGGTSSKRIKQTRSQE